jgi:hypothetical protein
VLFQPLHAEKFGANRVVRLLKNAWVRYEERIHRLSVTAVKIGFPCFAEVDGLFASAATDIIGGRESLKKDR